MQTEYFIDGQNRFHFLKINEKWTVVKCREWHFQSLEGQWGEIDHQTCCRL